MGQHQPAVVYLEASTPHHKAQKAQSPNDDVNDKPCKDVLASLLGVIAGALSYHTAEGQVGAGMASVDKMYGKELASCGSAADTETHQSSIHPMTL